MGVNLMGTTLSAARVALWGGASAHHACVVFVRVLRDACAVPFLLFQKNREEASVWGVTGERTGQGEGSVQTAQRADSSRAEDRIAR